jgi:hypothetical protein
VGYFGVGEERATVSGGTPTTTNEFCSPAKEFTGVKLKAAIAPTAARLLRTGGIDIIILPWQGGREFVRLQAIAMEGLDYAAILRLLFPLFMLKTVRGSTAK